MNALPLLSLHISGGRQGINKSRYSIISSRDKYHTRNKQGKGIKSAMEGLFWTGWSGKMSLKRGPMLYMGQVSESEEALLEEINKLVTFFGIICFSGNFLLLVKLYQYMEIYLAKDKINLEYEIKAR